MGRPTHREIMCSNMSMCLYAREAERDVEALQASLDGIKELQKRHELSSPWSAKGDDTSRREEEKAHLQETINYLKE